MEAETTPKEPHQMKFHGEGGTLFGIVIINTILTFFTLGFYYPWARAKLLKYFYSQTEFNGNVFEFHGTGREMFMGFLKAMGIFVLINALFLYGALGKHFILLFVAYLLIFAIIPFAIHGSLRYRMSRTSWRGIHFAYHGEIREFAMLFYKNVFFSIISLGLYSAWANVNIHKYTEGNIGAGNARLRFDGDGADYFTTNLLGYILTIFTLGIYSFWWITNLHKFFINNTVIEQNGNSYSFKTNITGGAFFKLSIVNLLLIIFTLGIGMSWVRIRTMRFYIENMELDGAFDPDSLTQSEDNYTDATGDDMLNMLDIDLA